VLPCPGIPVSFEQIEEHSRQFVDGPLTIESTVSGRVYRDSAGRLRLESDTRNGHGHRLSFSVSLTDPVAGFRAALLDSEKVAYLMPFPVSGESRFFFCDAADGQESQRKWKIKTENKGKRTIEGIEFQGTQIITTAEDEHRLTTVIEQWYSDELKLIGAVDRSGPYKTYTIRIQNVNREDPDPALFVIPANYKVIDFELPLP
jgi:hypothetical protein